MYNFNARAYILGLDALHFKLNTRTGIPEEEDANKSQEDMFFNRLRACFINYFAQIYFMCVLPVVRSRNLFLVPCNTVRKACLLQGGACNRRRLLLCLRLRCSAKGMSSNVKRIYSRYLIGF